MPCLHVNPLLMAETHMPAYMDLLPVCNTDSIVLSTLMIFTSDPFALSIEPGIKSPILLFASLLLLLLHLFLSTADFKIENKHQCGTPKCRCDARRYTSCVVGIATTAHKVLLFGLENVAIVKVIVIVIEPTYYVSAT